MEFCRDCVMGDRRAVTSTLSSATLTDAKLTNANFHRATLIRTTLSIATLINVSRFDHNKYSLS